MTKSKPSAKKESTLQKTKKTTKTKANENDSEKVIPKVLKEAVSKTTTQLLQPLIKDAPWKELLKEVFTAPYFKSLEEAVAKEMETKTIFPPRDLIFNTLNLTPLNKVKVVILGQDPYHDDGQAHGLAFSVPHGIKCPPSLKNIYKELETDIPGFKAPTHGCLEKWAQQGVIMLNAFLTVEAHKAGSHSRLGWERFTNDLLSRLSKHSSGLVFVLWGKFAEKKKSLIVSNKEHLVLVGGHPSPLSVRYFLGCRHFSKINDFLSKRKLDPIDWSL